MQELADIDGTGALLWEATWGPKQDQLIEFYAVSARRCAHKCPWGATRPRTTGTRSSATTVTTFPLGHDESGRLTQGPVYDYVYDVHGRLVAALDALDDDGVFDDVVELYLYDADGRLVHALFARFGARTSTPGVSSGPRPARSSATPTTGTV